MKRLTLNEKVEVMFRYAGYPYPGDLALTGPWYTRYTWTSEQESKFCAWLERQFRKEGWPPSRLQRKLAVAMFMLSYGFRVKPGATDFLKRGGIGGIR